MQPNKDLFVYVHTLQSVARSIIQSQKRKKKSSTILKCEQSDKLAYYEAHNHFIGPVMFQLLFFTSSTSHPVYE